MSNYFFDPKRILKDKDLTLFRERLKLFGFDNMILYVNLSDFPNVSSIDLIHEAEKLHFDVYYYNENEKKLIIGKLNKNIKENNNEQI